MASICIASESDMGSISELMRSYYEEDGYRFEESKAQKAILELIHDNSLGCLWVIKDDSPIIGYFAVTLGFSLEYQGRDAFIDELYINPEYRGHGLGKEALAIAEVYCRSHDVKALHLEVERHRQTALDIYRSNGFIDQNRHLMTKWL